MAIWQYRFVIVPKKALTLEKNKFQANSNDEFSDDEVFWLRSPVKVDVFDEVVNILPKGDSWSQNLIVFGNLESNCLEVYHENDLVESASFRVDFRMDFKNILDKVINFIQLRHFSIIDEDWKIVPDMHDIENLIKNSPQFDFYKRLTR